MMTATTTTKRAATKTVEIETWGYTGRCATVEGDVSDDAVRVRQDGEDTAARAYGRRMARVAGRGLMLLNSSSQGYDDRSATYQLTFGYRNAGGGGYDVAGTCWIKVYR
jgi:hypothetical protein